MRYLVGLMCVVAALLASPLSVGAQAGEEAGEEVTHSEPNLREPAPSAEPARKEPAMQLKLDEAGVNVAPGCPPRTPEGYTLKEMKVRVKRAKIGIGASALSLVVGGILAGVAVPNLSCESSGTGVGDCPIPGWSLPVFVTGVTLAGGGVLGMIATGALLGVRKRKLGRDVSGTGIQLSLDDWLSAGKLCDLRITTHTGRMIYKRARVIWTRRVGERCVSGLEVVGSIAPHTPDDD